jgi:hypothetical protein
VIKLAVPMGAIAFFTMPALAASEYGSNSIVVAENDHDRDRHVVIHHRDHDEDRDRRHRQHDDREHEHHGDHDHEDHDRR